LRGDAGVGKSTLIQRVSVKAAAQGWRVLLSTAVEAEASVFGRGERPQGRADDGAQLLRRRISRPIRGGRDRA
jgi:predicted ATP-dependent serine protease